MTREAALEALAYCRQQIDHIDRRLLALLNERMRIVEQIGRLKQILEMPIYEPKREGQVLENVTNENGGPLSPEAVRRVFERIIDEMRNVQRLQMPEGEDDEET